MIPPEQSARFVAKMEDVLSVYRRPYDSEAPVVCMDEMSRELIGEDQEPLPPEPGREKRYDHHFERNGVVNLFTFFEPLASWRTVMARRRRTGRDWAECVGRLLTEHYPDADTVVLVMDNLNTHKLKNFYETFEAKKARRFAHQLEIHFTPEHGSWLNMAEIEQSVLARQCLSARIPTLESMRTQTRKWARRRNRADATVDWQFRTDDARIKLKNLYPNIES